jgi:hypothetical protein
MWSIPKPVSSFLKVLFVLVVGVALTLIDKRVHIPAPPAALLGWATWVVAGATIFYGGTFLHKLREDLRRQV